MDTSVPLVLILFAVLSASPASSPVVATAEPTAPMIDKSEDVSATSGAFDTKVRTLEEQVTDLKERVFRTKARLLLLQETVLGGDLSVGARAVLMHRNEMGGSFILESVAYALDGAPIFTKADVSGDLSQRQEFEIFNGRIVPGQHQVAVKLAYRGHGFGVFSYLEGYKFRVQSSYTFTAEPGRVTELRVVGFERGGITSDLKDKPAVRYDIAVTRDTSNPGQAPTSAAK